METLSVLPALYAGNSPVTGKCPSQRAVTWSFDVFFDLCLNKSSSKQSRLRWFEAPSRSLWRHCNDVKFVDAWKGGPESDMQIPTCFCIVIQMLFILVLLRSQELLSRAFAPIQWNPSSATHACVTGRQLIYIFKSETKLFAFIFGNHIELGVRMGQNSHANHTIKINWNFHRKGYLIITTRDVTQGNCRKKISIHYLLKISAHAVVTTDCNLHAI